MCVFVAVQAVLSLWREGVALRSCVWASRGCGSSWGAGAPGHVGFSGCWVWAQHSQRPGSRAQTPSPRRMGSVWALPGPGGGGGETHVSCMGTGSLTTGPPGKPQSRTQDGSLDVTAFSWRGSKRSGQGEGHNLDVLSMGSLSPGGAVQTPIREEGDDFAFL